MKMNPYILRKMDASQGTLGPSTDVYFAAFKRDQQAKRQAKEEQKKRDQAEGKQPSPDAS